MFKRGQGREGDVMSRQEAAVWLGRALSTSEVTMRILLQFSDIILLQQQVIQALYQKSLSHTTSSAPAEALQEMDRGLSDNLQTRLREIRGQVQPILTSVDDSCRVLEAMLSHEGKDEHRAK